MKGFRNHLFVFFVASVLFALAGCSPKEEISAEQKPLAFEKSDQKFSPRMTTQIRVGDLDGDSDLDAVFANMGFNHSQVLFNNGSGFFEDSGQRLTQVGHGLGLGDLDNDGDLDIFISCSGYRADQNDEWTRLPSRIYLNDGHGFFQDTGQDLGDKELAGNAVYLHDFDRDGDLDAAIFYYRDTSRIYLNDGRGYFTSSDLPFPDKARWADFNSDGYPDAFQGEVGQGYRLLLNDRRGGLEEMCFVEDPDVIRFFPFFGDVDNDSDQDVLVVNGNTKEYYPVKVLFNDGKGNLTDSGQKLFASRVGRIGLGDLDNDGDLDAVITDYEAPHQIWLNDGSGHFSDSGIRLEHNRAFNCCIIEDLDGDGDKDLLFASFFGGENQIWFNKIF
jgi:hypothetical protein